MCNKKCEIAMNLYPGRPTVTPYYRSKLKTHKTLLQSLADRSVDNKDVKTLLRRHPEAISLILKPHWKDNGRIIRSGGKKTPCTIKWNSDRMNEKICKTKERIPKHLTNCKHLSNLNLPQNPKSLTLDLDWFTPSPWKGSHRQACALLRPRRKRYGSSFD